MSCLDATFTLTPLSPYFSDGANYASLGCYGPDFDPYSPWDLSSQCASNRFYFSGQSGSDSNLDYKRWANRRQARFLFFEMNLQSYATAYSSSP